MPAPSSTRPILLAGCSCVAVGALLVLVDLGHAGAPRVILGAIVLAFGVLLIVLGEIERHRRPDGEEHAAIEP